MHIGQFNLMGYRTPGTTAQVVLDRTVEQVKAAEQAGIEVAWFAEHHFSNYSICPSPLLMVARLAGETRRIRLGPAVVVVPLYNPARLLAEIGMVDSLTHGRLVLGLGSGYQPYEFERFGEALEGSGGRLAEFVDLLDRAFATETFRYAGKHIQMPDTHIAARPVAGPPPIWTAGENPELISLAARRGFPIMLSLRHYSAELLAAARKRIEVVFAAEGRQPEALKLGVLRPICVTESKAEAEDFLDNVRYQIRLSQSLRHREQALKGGMLVEQPYRGEPSLADMARHLLVGDAETIAERMLAEMRLTRPHHYLLQFQTGAVPHAVALRSIERFAADVKPRLEKALGPLAAL